MTSNAWATALAMTRSHGIRIRRLRLSPGGASSALDIDFCAPDDRPRPLTVLADPFGLGSTTILDLIDYCLGATHYRPAPAANVREVSLEADLSGTPYVIQRAVGASSGAVNVWAGRIDERGGPPERRIVRPASDPASLSSLLLAHCKLEGAQLRDGATRTGAEPLTFRNLMWVCYQRGDRRVGNDLLFEEQPLKHKRLRLVVDIVFDVNNDRSVELRRSIKAAEARVAAARSARAAAEDMVREQGLGLDRAALEEASRAAQDEVADVVRTLADLDVQARAATRFAEELRARHREAARAAGQAATKLRDAETQLARMVPLRAQYADDVSRLVMMAEAHTLFDPRGVVACPVCLSRVDSESTVANRCFLCHSEPATRELADADERVDLGAELRAGRARHAELTRYIEDLERALPELRAVAQRARDSEARAAAELDAVTSEAVTPFLGQRDALTRRRVEAAVASERSSIALRLLQSLQDRADDLSRQEAALASLREELVVAGAPNARPNRSGVVRRVSDRYAEILSAWRYPNLADAHLGDDLIPFARGHVYRGEPPSGRTLIALAWQLAVFEIAWEAGTSHPGFLLFDDPQNLGGAGQLDADTAAQVYRHLSAWLAGRGAGAQIIVADSAPPNGAQP